MPKKQLTYFCSSDYVKYREHMLDLHQREYGTETGSSRFYDSFYPDNPAGNPLLGLCFDGDRLVAQENYIYQPVASRGTVHGGAIGINTIVDPKYRLFYGVFKKLVQLTMDELKQDCDVLGAYANEDSKKYYLKYFNWQVAANVGLYKKFIGRSGSFAERMLSLLRPGKQNTKVRLTPTALFEPGLLDSIINDHVAHTKYSRFHKSAAFLNWKFLQNSFYQCKGYYIESRGRVCGYVVVCEDADQLKIADFLIEHDDTEIFEAMVQTLACTGAANKHKRLVIYATPGCWYVWSLRKHFFFRRWSFEYIAAVIGQKNIDPNWVVQMGDFDIM